jgi:hypothetical protein
MQKLAPSSNATFATLLHTGRLHTLKKTKIPQKRMRNDFFAVKSKLFFGIGIGHFGYKQI